MLYVIPFVLLLVILVVLKKRESTNNEKGKETARKTTKKNAARTARSSQRQASNTQVVQDEVIVQKQATPLSAELKQSIEQLIREKNFFSAEAKINQALNQDNSQHDLYLYLLDVHLAHKDEFAIDQLVNHVRSLGLEDIAQQAEAKQKVYAEENKAQDTIEFIQPSAKTNPEAQTIKNHAAFDALVDSSSAQSNVEQVQDTSNTPQAIVEPAPLEFSFVNESVPTIVEEPQKTPEPTVEIKPLEFTFTTPATAEVEVPATPNVAEPVQKTDIQPLDFSFDLSPKTEAPQHTPLESVIPENIEIANDFKLDFAEPIAPIVEQTVEATTPAIADFEFKFEIPEVEAPTHSTLELDPPSLATETPVLVEPLHFEKSHVVESITESHDPLAQSFPELIQVNEMQLNLELAEQYIELGAYESAQQLLNQDAHQYSAEQLSHSQNLLNRIAS
ncbi:hypothetical protein [Acinetobacter silvestris]|uniref:FimV domain-containing protein n=1 Tax=Acinetobacter silvestris TaxID=1977882 RepID=A0A1Y3CKF8_9GAMM|nr:hypothetical protein [Acinetobacter silvestris]OTG67082.1 hypothetical protein B9T28_00050 [Acinetobacter silvestris]